jgi:FkbM family methyltransferase
VSSLPRALWLYKLGFSRRCRDICTSYCLDRVKYNPGDIVLDVGANYGDLKLYLDSVNAQIRYIAFEPGEIDYYCLMLNHGNEDMIKQNLNVYLQTALGSLNGEMNFYDDTKSASSSLLPVPGAINSYSVVVKCLDTVVREHSLSGKFIKLLKLEAEGLEPEVCRGMTQTLPFINYIAADLGYERGMEQETTAPDVINFLLLNNFQVLDANLKDGRFLFVNRSLILEA